MSCASYIRKNVNVKRNARVTDDGKYCNLLKFL